MKEGDTLALKPPILKYEGKLNHVTKYKQRQRNKNHKVHLMKTLRLVTTINNRRNGYERIYTKIRHILKIASRVPM